MKKTNKSEFTMWFIPVIFALIGQKYGVIKFNDKTLEGSIAFFLTSILIILSFSSIYIFPAMIAVIVATFVESFRFFNIDDNLTVPLSFAITYSSVIYFLNNSIFLGIT